jgi:hypothetical protein
MGFVADNLSVQFICEYNLSYCTCKFHCNLFTKAVFDPRQDYDRHIAQDSGENSKKNVKLDQQLVGNIAGPFASTSNSLSH